MEVLDLAYFAVNNDISSGNTETGPNANEGNSDNMLVRKEIFELILRMGLSK